MDPLSIFLTGVLAPAVAAGLVLAIGWQLWRRTPEKRDGRWSAAPALGLGFLVGYWFVSGWPASLLPGAARTPTGLDWLAWLTMLGALILPFGAKLGRFGLPLGMAWAALVVRLVLRNAFASTWDAAEGWTWFAGLFALYLALWAALERIASRRSGASGPLVLWVLAVGLAVLASLTGSARIGQLGGTLAAGLGAAVVIAWRWPRLSLSGSGVALALTILFGLGLNAHVFSYTSGTDLLLFACAPFLALLGGIPWLSKRRPWQQTAAQVLLILIPVGIALTRATLAFLESATDEYGY